ncbi:hypothetical protein DPMN_191687 [Dreissena polymorpha]|uniref:Uncharacterized protein n=1 Tax=Dreissena polymorpha TaxID=45954 RepID=A0A9D4B723_DREPO|nr:hypothetical protein DPMN_191687 [Dreissena polymorpha]
MAGACVWCCGQSHKNNIISYGLFNRRYRHVDFVVGKDQYDWSCIAPVRDEDVGKQLVE